MSNKQVAEIILEQLGGSKFMAMTGSKCLTYDNNTLNMILQKNESIANNVSITLESNDTYKIKFIKFTAGRLNKKTFLFSEPKIKTIAEYEGVYAEDLQKIFTKVTGFDCTL